MWGMAARCGSGALLAAAASLLALASAAIALTWPSIFDAILAGELALSPTSRSFAEWVSPSVPLHFDIYLYNWTNAARFPEEKPHLHQLGPYRFTEIKKKVNITWHAENSSVSYRTFRSWHFDEEGSEGSLEDNITSLNVIAAAAVHRARDWDFLRQKALSMGLSLYGQRMSTSKLARQWLFEGYEDALLDLAKNLPSSATGGAPPVDRFGFFYQRNNTLDTDGFLEVSTGAVSGSLPGQVLRWNHEARLPYFSGPCAMLNGTLGEFMPRRAATSAADTLQLFSPDLCRTLTLHYSGAARVHGIPLHTYAALAESFDNGTANSENSCFCSSEEEAEAGHGEECAWGGTLNVSACRHGSPAFISLPHFLHGEPALLHALTGLQPDPDKHSFYFSVEPNTGVPLDVAARFQLNFLISPNSNIALYSAVPRMLFPVLWVEQRVVVPAATALELQPALAAATWGAPLAAAFAIFWLAVALTPLIRCKSRAKVNKDFTALVHVGKTTEDMKMNGKVIQEEMVRLKP